MAPLAATRTMTTPHEPADKLSDFQVRATQDAPIDDQVAFHRREDRGDSESTDENFDEIEASAQELHDIVFAMVEYLRKTDPDRTKEIIGGSRNDMLFKQASTHEKCLVPSALYGGRAKSYASKKELDDATTLFLELGPKLMLHLRKDVMKRMLANTRRFTEINSSSRLSVRRNFVAKAQLRGFHQAPHYRHAPFEIQNLRSDIPNSYVDHSRALRDRGTISSLKALMEPQHPFRQQLELRMFEICEEIGTHS
ncbi:Hypothetical protein, putative [Bodo saltans]|uniref:Uncharacterized protein n=1 Tax=Bodo saltans TaxID=75058 RepID=A0A0S4ITL7_BODSA|nr:Hypothetical protein, putative [Bodo saltans]|eukprot:CUE76210.1 Hypothetical protein, putative [Bodo saltans]